MKRYLLGFVTVAILVAALIYFYPGQRTGGMDSFDHALNVFLRWPNPVPTPPAATSPAPEREPGTSTTLPTPSPQNLSMLTVRVQTALMRQGYYKGDIDGIPGPQTGAAIIEYQKAQELPQTGRMDTQTLARLGISIP